MWNLGHESYFGTALLSYLSTHMHAWEQWEACIQFFMFCLPGCGCDRYNSLWLRSFQGFSEIIIFHLFFQYFYSSAMDVIQVCKLFLTKVSIIWKCFHHFFMVELEKQRCYFAFLDTLWRYRCWKQREADFLLCLVLFLPGGVLVCSQHLGQALVWLYLKHRGEHLVLHL